MTKGYKFNSEITRFTPATGDTITIPDSQAEVIAIVAPAGTIATLTIAMGTAYNGRRIIIVSTQIITAITVTGGTLINSLTTLALGGKVSYIYDSVSASYLPA